MFTRARGNPILCRLLLATMMCTLINASALAQDEASRTPEVETVNGFDPPPAVIDRSKAIQTEAATLAAHPWAGEYYEGDGLGANVLVSVSPTAGVSATWHGCMGLYGANEGTIEIQPNGNLKFAFHKPNKDQFGGFPDEVVPVRWGERRYLIRNSQMYAFVNAIHRGREPRTSTHGMFLLARDDEKKQVQDLPDLPLEYRSAIRVVPLELATIEVTALGEMRNEYRCSRRYRLTLDRGERDGIVTGVILDLAAPHHRYEQLTVTTAQTDRATGELEITDGDCDDAEPVPDISWRFTTGAYVSERYSSRDAGHPDE